MTRVVLITGGAGFIGASYAHHRLQAGDRVIVLDNLSRAGSGRNLEQLQRATGGRRLEVVVGDVRDRELVVRLVGRADAVVHLAAQVSVTASLRDPVTDFEVNAGGTLNVLEGARRAAVPPTVLYASSNKVYGDLGGVPVCEEPTRYRFAALPHGVGEDQPIRLCTPYACSKGAGDLYLRDAWASFGVPTVVLRQSCVYGPRQLGSEEQGWVMWLVLAVLGGRAVTIFGDGKQVRDVLFIDDLMACYDLAFDRIATVAGQAFNIGGGPGFTLSVWHELAPLLDGRLRRPTEVRFEAWRPGDQRVYVSDIRRAAAALDWRPGVSPADGVQRLVRWLEGHHAMSERGGGCGS